jgi:hypothetical protein
VVKFVTAKEGLGCESVSDFAGFWTSVTDSFQSDVIAHISLEDRAKRIQLSRLRVAWQQANSEQQRIPGQEPADPEAPLSQPEADQLQKGWGAVGIRFHPECTPAQHLLNRVFREFSKRHRTIDEIGKMRSVANTPIIGQETRKQLGDVSIVFQGQLNSRELPPLPLDSILQVTQAHEVMCNMWAMSGTSSITAGDSTEADAPYSACLYYHSFVKGKLADHPSLRHGGHRDAIAWTIDRDRRTRLCATELYNVEKISWAAALTKATEKLGVLWTVTDDAKTVLSDNDRTPSQAPRSTGSKQQKQQSQARDRSPRRAQPTEFCKAWNSAEGCTRKQKDCPQRAKHVCSFVPSGGGDICGAWNHNKQVHLKSIKGGKGRGKPFR